MNIYVLFNLNFETDKNVAKLLHFLEKLEVDAVFIEHLVHLTIPPVVDIGAFDDVGDSRKEKFSWRTNCYCYCLNSKSSFMMEACV